MGSPKASANCSNEQPINHFFFFRKRYTDKSYAKTISDLTEEKAKIFEGNFVPGHF